MDKSKQQQSRASNCQAKLRISGLVAKFCRNGASQDITAMLDVSVLKSTQNMDININLDFVTCKPHSQNSQDFR